MLIDPLQVFGNCALEKCRISPLMGTSRDEYVKLASAQLKCGKLGLLLTVFGGGSTFAVPKSTPGRFREVWNGQALSISSNKPPKARRLGNPSSFLEVVTEPGENLLYSKRGRPKFL